MERLLQIQKLLLRSQRLPWLVSAMSVAILGGAVFLTTQQIRVSIRAQIAGRDAEVLYAVARMQMQTPDTQESDDLLSPIDDPANQLALVFETSRMREVMGTRLFRPNGEFVGSVPAEVLASELASGDLSQLQALKPTSHFHPAMASSQLFLPEAGGLASEAHSLPVLEVNVPLHTMQEPRLVGIAQFLIQGFSIAEEFAQLDRHLARQALTAFLAGGLILLAAISWSFRRLNHAHRLLAERTENLLKANRELALAAKTSAVGAVTAHLIHGLKNPLSGLQNFVAGLGASVADHPDADLQQAIASTRRMQAMINEVVSVLHEEEGAGQYEIPVAELVEIITAKVKPLCLERRVELKTRLETAGIVLPNRVANLVALILGNIVQNGIEATPMGKGVTLALVLDGEHLLCEARDQGPGISAGRDVFAPCPSTKEGGSGIGLAISKQLANHLGAGLELQDNSPAGCVFLLSLPASLWKSKTSSVTITLG